MNQPDGREPAFPVPADYYTAGGRREECHSGMSLRDAFALSAMQGLLFHTEDGSIFATTSSNNYFSIISERSYALADAMLQQREAQET